jgi:uncharacterized protein
MKHALRHPSQKLKRTPALNTIVRTRRAQPLINLCATFAGISLGEHNPAQLRFAMNTVDILQAILKDPTSLDNVKRWTSPDVEYVSLNYSHPDLKKIMPWCGTGHGPEVIVKTFIDVSRFWDVIAFEPQATFGDTDNVAMFGRFTYRSTVLGKTVTSPFAIWARFKDDKCTYLQFMEDTLATSTSFKKSGSWTFHSDPQGGEVTF